MLEFETTSGRKYLYNRLDNRISLLNKTHEHQVNPIVSFHKLRDEYNTESITMYTIEMTQQCNLRCTYCCYSGLYHDRRAHNEKEISWEILEETIRFIDKTHDKQSEFTVCFYGGEALLAKEKMRWIVDNLYKKYGNQIIFSLSTNGLSLSIDTIDWICSYPQFYVNVSIDGNKELHDSFRKTINGKGSFDIIHKNLENFKLCRQDDYFNRVRFLSTVGSFNNVRFISECWNADEILNHTRPVRISHLIPNFDDNTRQYDTFEDKDRFYSDALKQYIKGEKNVSVDALQRIVAIIENRTFYDLPHSQAVKTCLNEMYTCFINVEGLLYACEKFCGESSIGHVSSGFNLSKMNQLYYKLIERKNTHCTDCWASRLCRMCLTSLNFQDKDIPKLCQMEKDTLKLALKYYCEIKEYESVNKKTIKK